MTDGMVSTLSPVAKSYALRVLNLSAAKPESLSKAEKSKKALAPGLMVPGQTQPWHQTYCR
jgi:hypothetical protein